MTGERNLQKMIKAISPRLNDGEYVFTTIDRLDAIPRGLAICEFKEDEGFSLIIAKEIAEDLALSFHYVAKWITLEIHSALDAVGLTAAFAKVLAENDISCNVVAGFFHDHIFVDVNDAQKAIKVLNDMANAT
jgi:hypothetical protein